MLVITDTSEMIGLKLYVGNSLPWKSLWKPKVPTNVIVFPLDRGVGENFTVDNLWRAFSLFGVHWVLRGFLLIGWASLAGIRLW